MRNIHGHMHSKCVYALDYNSDPIPDKRYVCVSVEQTNFQPILLQKVIQS
jgi:calcineurin-like phosphoesterase family protein